MGAEQQVYFVRVFSSLLRDENLLESSHIKYEFEFEHAHCTSFHARQQNEKKSHDSNNNDNKKSQLKSSTAKEEKKPYRRLGTVPNILPIATHRIGIKNYYIMCSERSYYT